MSANTSARESLGSRLGFILISAGCAIGLGNVWRFPYIVGQYGGAAFILLYLVFLVIFGLPIMTMEFSVGRAGKSSAVGAFRNTEPKGTKWHIAGYFGTAGNYLLMMFYTVISGWMIAYFCKTVTGKFDGLDAAGVGEAFGNFTANGWQVLLFTAIAIGLGFLVCSLGLQKGVEKVTKVMMLALLLIISGLAIFAVTLPGAGEGLKFYLVPDFGKLFGENFGEALFAAMGQAFFTLSIGMGSMAIFGSYIGKERSLFGESVTIAGLDTFVALVAGLIIFPSCSAYGIETNAGPGLIFVTLPNVFNHMGPVLGRIFGSLFFLFMVFAAMSTVIAVFENIISFAMDEFHWSRKKACLINFALVLVLCLPCLLGFTNVLSGFQPLGEGTMVLDLEDFLVSNNILPLGSLVYVLFCTLNKKWAWGYDNFVLEERGAKGLHFPKALRVYVSYVLPVIIVILWVQGYISLFFS